MRVLIIANECNPEWPSLPGVAYRAARAIAGVAEVTLATHVRNKEAMERSGVAGARVEYIDNEYIARPMYRLSTRLRGGEAVSWTTEIAMTYLPNLAFEWEVWRRFGRDLKTGEFDVVHRLTPMSPTLSSPLAKWSPAPVVIGPLNGGLRWPRGFMGELAREREWLTFARRAHRRLPYYGATYRRAAAVLAAFGHTIADLPRTCRGRLVNFPEVGIDPGMFRRPAREQDGRVTILFAGRLVPYKCADVVLEAVAASPVLRRQRVVIVGDGPERGNLEMIVRERGLEGTVEMLGWRSQAEVGEIMRRSEVFAFPSIRELGAGVVVEAMASGMASVVVDYGGPGTLIGPGRGVKVPLRTKEEIRADFTRELEGLVADAGARRAMGEAAREHALRHYSWEAKAAVMLEVYRWVTGERPDKPVFWPAMDLEGVELKPVEYGSERAAAAGSAAIGEPVEVERW